ncbi:MAG: hypothetical protein OER56_04320 [Hyphomicrobiales bacterium]|nr:hypothetical protein [Hyphomicrobiales bacterium]
MTNKIEHVHEAKTGWHRLSGWLKALDVGMDLDPVEHSLLEANRKIAQLRARVLHLETQEQQVKSR